MSDGERSEATGTDGTVGEREAASFVEYGIEDRPPLGTSVLLGFQHYLTMIGASVAIPLVLATTMGMPDWATARLIGTFFVVSGVATLGQTTIGNRYPIVQGGTFSMLAPAIAIILVLQDRGVGWETMIVNLQGAVIVAGLTEMGIGYFGVMGRLKRYVGPLVISPVITLIGLSLFGVPQITDVMSGVEGAQQNWWLLGATVVLIVLFSQYLDRRSRAFKLFPVLLGLAVAWMLAAVLSVAGVYAPGSPGYVDLGAVAAAQPLQPIVPFQWGLPAFEASFVVGMFAGMLASVIESFGDYHSVARMAGKGAPSPRRIDHGIGMEGLGSLFAGIMGTGNGCTSYTENVGAIGITGVASRYVVQIGAVVMLLVGYVGYFGTLFATMPAPIIGGLYVVMFGQIAAVGLSSLKYVDLDKQRNIFVVGFSLFAGLAIPAYMGGISAGQLQAGLADVAVLGPALGTDVVAQTVYVIGGTGMAVGGLLAFFLDNTIPGTDEERGLTAWRDLTEDDAEFVSVVDRIRGRDGGAPTSEGD
ncbi:uracil-xanthine permease family protein [Halomarina litorea]|uniref:uracil-xanthine permease family protein n=1 Tax=Halomarina litorea TaxID=2961595 RepID=UPI0020C3E43F|nr:solute carrier family 23 protein [Halomarina sp. BCD28]